MAYHYVKPVFLRRFFLQKKANIMENVYGIYFMLEGREFVEPE